MYSSDAFPNHVAAVIHFAQQPVEDNPECLYHRIDEELALTRGLVHYIAAIVPFLFQALATKSDNRTVARVHAALSRWHVLGGQHINNHVISTTCIEIMFDNSECIFGSCKNERLCFYYHKPGHVVLDCQILKRKQVTASQQPKGVGIIKIVSPISQGTSSADEEPDESFKPFIFSASVSLTVLSRFPVNGVDFIMGNDIFGGKVYLTPTECRIQVDASASGAGAVLLQDGCCTSD
ncbi:hypothetical protein F2P81_003935 [Scophthalmus maximus]|uniref:Uncharacterized protein n=1 Tax=Scophthalmus maximus TaxID=52904 RepID=A0A6A4TDX8_SCOMX|nr:hypothetical protein F2P81_003935 [Scophthalmus maximus]